MEQKKNHVRRKKGGLIAMPFIFSKLKIKAPSFIIIMFFFFLKSPPIFSPWLLKFHNCNFSLHFIVILLVTVYFAIIITIYSHIFLFWFSGFCRVRMSYEVDEFVVVQVMMCVRSWLWWVLLQT